MRIRVSHETVYTYGQPATGVIQTLRLTPRNHGNQYVIDWRISVSEDCRLDAHEDAFGNLAHSFTADGPFSELRVSVEGIVETQDTHGVMAGTLERFPPALYLRETSLTRADDAIIGFAEQFKSATEDDVLSALHALLAALHDGVTYDRATATLVELAAEALAAGDAPFGNRIALQE